MIGVWYSEFGVRGEVTSWSGGNEGTAASNRG